jgi:hypothetical protein
MNTKEAINKIKKLLFEETPEAAPMAEAIQVETTDGKMLTLSAMEVGATAMMDDVAAEDGEYELMDGTKLTIEAGLVTEIKEAGIEPTEEITEEMPSEDMAKFKAEFSALRNDFDTHKANFAAVQNELKGQKEAFSKLLEVVEAMSNASVQSPVSAPKKFEEMSALEKFKLTRKNK